LKFIKSVQTPTRLSEIVLVHQQAVIQWDAQVAGIRDRGEMSEIETMIAYWVARTGKDLLLHSYIEPDRATQEAAGWLRKVYDDKSTSAKFFSRNTTTRSNMGDILEKIDGSTSLIYNSVIVKLEGETGTWQPDFCRRIKSLNALFRAADPIDIATYDRLFANTLVMEANKLECSHRSARAQTNLTDADLEEMKVDLDKAQKAVAAARQENRFSAAIRRIEAVIREAELFLQARS